MNKVNKEFISNDLDASKYNELKEIAEELLVYRNEISPIVHNDLLYFMNIGKFDFITHFTNYYKDKGIDINSQFKQELFMDVYTVYKNRQVNILNNVKFKRPKKYDGYTINDTYSTNFLSIINYLVKMINENLSLDDNITLLTYKIEEYRNISDSRKTDIQKLIIHYFDKFNVLLIKLLYNKKITDIERKNNLITFSKLTFRGHSQRKTFIDYNKHFSSVINAFATIVTGKNKQIDIPIKFNKDYHGSIGKYKQHKNSIKYEYIIQILPKKTVRINYVIDDNKEYYNMLAKDPKIIGVDVNCKNNLLALSNNTTIDYDRKYYKDFSVFQKHIDNLKSNDSNYRLGKKTLNKQRAIKKRQVDLVTRLVVECCKNLYSSGYETISMEDLKNTFAKTKLLVDDVEINQNRKNSFLGLSSVKNIFIRIAPKYNLNVRLVNPNYTSQKCSNCGCIDKDNRKSQEEFVCVKCGYTNNADINAAINIKNLLSVIDESFVATDTNDDDLIPHRVNSIF